MSRLSRRSLLVGAGGILGSGAGCLSLPDRSTFEPADWPQVQADAGKTNYSSTPGPVADAEVAWRQPFDALDTGFYASLFLVDGTVYVGSNAVRRSYFSPAGFTGDIGALYGVDATSGDIQFRVPNVDAVYGVAGTRTYTDGVVLAGQTEGGAPRRHDEDRTLGLNPSGGVAAQRWNVQRPAPHGWRGARPGDSITVADGTWFYCPSGEPATVRAVDVDDGRKRWTRRLDATGRPTLLADSERVVVAVDGDDEGATLHVFDHDGTTVERIDVQDSTDAPAQLALRDGSITRVSVAEQVRVTSHDAQTLGQTWQETLNVDGRSNAHLAVSPEYVVAVVGQRRDETLGNEWEYPTILLGLDRESGELRWRTDMEIGETRIVRTLAIGNRTVYVGTERGSVLAFALADGTERWRIESERTVSDDFEPIGELVESLVVGDGRVYLWDGSSLIALEEP